ncbi:MAG: sigma-70 family RNA polymerase sigma factor [Pyrinomonadaceae bacterium]
MDRKSSLQITKLLVDWGRGDEEALEKLMPLVYDELRRLAGHFMNNQKAGHTLQTTALVNEAYLRLIDSSRVRWQDRTHFFAVSAQLMRRILVDAARTRNSLKRGGPDAQKIELDENLAVSPNERVDLLALDEALEELARMSPRQSQVVELRYFGGLSEEEIAEALKISARTVRREWSAARAWLYRELSKSDGL